MLQSDKDEWIHRLESNEYEHGRESYHYRDMYCAIGVLTTMEGYGLSECSPRMVLGDRIHDEIVTMNDEQGKSFSEIAIWIKENV